MARLIADDQPPGQFLFVAIVMLLAMLAQMHTTTSAKTHYHYWTVETTNMTKNCVPVNTTTVNGQLPGPTVEIDEGDTVVINVTNLAQYEVSIHWHGIFQFLSNWADGPVHITQCPLMIGSTQIYEFTVTGQSGTFFWHAHTNWLRATVYGAFIVHPADTPPYGEVDGEFSILAGEWYSEDPNEIELDYIDSDSLPTINYDVAFTVNGEPGPLYGCPDEIQVFQVVNGSTYLLRLTNVGLNDDIFFQVANHTLTIVAAAGNYLQPFTTDYVVITPGQTYDVLLTANQPPGLYYYGVSLADVSSSTSPGARVPALPALAIIQYEGSNSSETPMAVAFVPSTNRLASMEFIAKLKGYDSYDLPQTPDQELVYVVGIAFVACTMDETNCTKKIAGTVQNITFDDPQTTSILEAYYNNVSGVFTRDFPDNPPVFEDFTSPLTTDYMEGSRGTRAKVIEFGDTVQLVLQNVWATVELDHPFHLHGHDFYVVGQNYSNFNPDVDPATFNLVDPPKFNTFVVPTGGWVAFRFRANNPGVWLLHCHIERHKTLGMEMVFVTYNGKGENETLPGPLYSPPTCS